VTEPNPNWGYVTTKSIGRAWGPATTAAGPTTTQQRPNPKCSVFPPLDFPFNHSLQATNSFTFHH